MAQIEPKLKLKSPNCDSESLILIKVYFNKMRFTYSTGEKIHPNFWDSMNQRVTIPRGDGKKDLQRKHREINKQIGRYEDEIERIFSSLFDQKIPPTPEILKRGMDKEFKVGSIKRKLDFIAFVELIIRESKEGTRLTKKGKHFNETTVKGYVTTLNHLRYFQEMKSFKLEFDTINMKFYGAFVKYFHEKNYTTNTIGKNIKNVKVFLKQAYKRNLTMNDSFMDEDFKVIEEETDQIYLSQEEIETIYNLDLSNKPRLDRVRDIFIIGCYTGLRFSDLEQLNNDNITDGGQLLRIKTQKTDELVVIPLHWMIKEIIQKYNGNLPRMISNQKFNDYIKEIGKLAGIDETVQIAKTKGGMRFDTKHKKYKLITVHTCRRSFATNMYLADIPSISIMKITGHRTEKAFLKYIKISPEENAKKLAKHPMFQPKLTII